MLIRFVYLDQPTLAGYVAQLDGGLIAETKVRLVKKGSGGGKINAKFLSLEGSLGKEDEHLSTMSYPPEAQFQRLLAVAFEEPDTINWVEVLEPDTDFASVQVGETIAWECDVDIEQTSRMTAQGGGGVKAIALIRLIVAANATGVGQSDITPEQAAVFQAQAEIVQQVIDSMGVKRVIVGNDNETEWSVFGELDNDHLRVDNIDAERLIVVGKVKRIVPEGERRTLVNTEAMQLIRQIAPDYNPTMGQIDGPALELDILSIYR